jgi:hypothetical protein
MEYHCGYVGLALNSFMMHTVYTREYYCNTSRLVVTKFVASMQAIEEISIHLYYIMQQRYSPLSTIWDHSVGWKHLMWTTGIVGANKGQSTSTSSIGLSLACLLCGKIIKTLDVSFSSNMHLTNKDNQVSTNSNLWSISPKAAFIQYTLL